MMQGSLNYSIAGLSEKAVVVQFESVIDLETLNMVLAFAKALEANPPPGFIESVPGYNSVTIYFDPLVVQESKLDGETLFDKVCGFLNSMKVEISTIAEGLVHRIPVCYDISLGLDLPELSQKLNLLEREIINKHSSETYTVYLIGFTPGFPYMGTLSKQLECGRKERPRKKVPAGSVAIAGKQTGVYPFDTPGGWQIIGQTPMKLFSLENEHPSLLKAGDRVKFEPISLEEFNRLKQS